jgi:hypothetical protein
MEVLTCVMILFVLLFMKITTYAYIFFIPSWLDPNPNSNSNFFSDSDPAKSFGFIWIRIRNTGLKLFPKFWGFIALGRIRLRFSSDVGSGQNGPDPPTLVTVPNVSDPHSLFADPDPGFYTIADLDIIPELKLANFCNA